MKQKKNKDISILLYALLLFSFGIGWVYSKTKQDDTQSNNTHADTQVSIIPTLPEPPKEIAYDVEKAAQEEELTTKEIIIYSTELIRSKNMTRLASLLKEKCPKKIILETISEILRLDKTQQELTRYEKLKIILSIAKYYEKDKELQTKIFDLIAQNKDIEDGKIPLMFAAIEIKESEIIPALAEWYRKSNRPEVRDIAEKTHEYAAKNDYGIVIKKLKESGVKIEPEYATNLLWENLKANKTNKNSILFESLKTLGADLNSQDKKTHFTPLIQAIKNKNLHAVKQLVKLGADPKLASKDKSIGYPLQIARELNLLEIENFLRDNGARD